MSEKVTSPRLNSNTSQNVVEYYKAGLKEPETVGWDRVGDMVTSLNKSIQQRRDEAAWEKEEKELKVKAYEDQFAKNSEVIAGNAGSLGEDYYSHAYDQAQMLQEQYNEAVKNDDKKLMGELKGKLNGLSTTVQTLKESMNTASELQSDENGESGLSTGMSAHEKLVNATCTDPSKMQYKEGEFVWANPEFDSEVEGSQEFFTIEDLNKSLVLRDDTVIEEYKTFENTLGVLGLDWQNGAEGSSGFDPIYYNASNKKMITEDNIATFLHDDVTGKGTDYTFAKQLGEYIEQVDYAGLGLDVAKWDKDGDGDVDEDDFALEQDREKLKAAITDRGSPDYNFETSRTIISEWMTMNQRKKFMGNIDETLVPEPGEDQDTFIKRGGAVGALAQKGIVWNENQGRFIATSTKSGQELLDSLKKKKK